jgi:hypothetical protein
MHHCICSRCIVGLSFLCHYMPSVMRCESCVQFPKHSLHTLRALPHYIGCVCRTCEYLRLIESASVPFAGLRSDSGVSAGFSLYACTCSEGRPGGGSRLCRAAVRSLISSSEYCFVLFWISGYAFSLPPLSMFCSVGFFPNAWYV